MIVTPAQPLDAEAARFDPASWPTAVEARRADDGLHLIVRSPADDHHLWAPEPITAGAAMSVLVPLDDLAAIRAEAALRFWRYLGHGDRPRRRRVTLASRRTALCLRAADGRRAGASYRTLAEVLLGREQVERFAWQTSPTRAATIRLVKRGAALIAGGYRKLLRGRPL